MHSTIAIDQSFQQAISDQVFSGAQLLAGRGEKRLFEGCYGTVSWVEGAPAVTETTLFDLASLTKPLATTPLILKLHESKQLNLDDLVQKYLPTFARREEITLRHLLSHTSGLPAYLPLFEEFRNEASPREKVRDRFIEEIHQVTLEAQVGEKRIYSDLGFILLGFILEEIGESPLDELFYREIVPQYGLSGLNFHPLPYHGETEDIAATEACAWRNKTLQGEVHDDNAYVLGGVAGHAGLFGNAGAVEKFIHALWELWDKGKTVDPDLGWDRVSRPKSQAGKFFGEEAFGHLAFTGCSLWLDPVDQKYVVLLCNRVHPGREGETIKSFRPKIHDVLLEQLGLT
ncbi:MAG: serine hydrolase domain-containing protein [bacterium]|nr:serine hydrolase domain-containing protein [bacterium]